MSISNASSCRVIFAPEPPTNLKVIVGADAPLECHGGHGAGLGPGPREEVVTGMVAGVTMRPP